MLKYQIS